MGVGEESQQPRGRSAVMQKSLLVQPWERDGTDRVPSQVKHGAGCNLGLMVPLYSLAELRGRSSVDRSIATVGQRSQMLDDFQTLS